MFSWKRWEFIGAGVVVSILTIYLVGVYLKLSILTDYWYTYTIVLFVAYAAFCLRGFYNYKKSQWAMYPKIKERALDAAEEKNGMITYDDLGKVPTQWYGWIIDKFEEENVAMPDPNNKKRILFPGVIAESHTPDEIVDLDLPTDLGSELMRKAKNKQSSKSEGSS